MGIKSEMEHKKTIEQIRIGNLGVKDAAKLIATDHLKEMPDYYTKLKEMERNPPDPFAIPSTFKHSKALYDEQKKEIKQRFGSNLQCSFAQDKKGVFCWTHRCRSKSYFGKIPFKVYKFICSTG